MLNIELHNRLQDDPVPCFATSTEIEIADRLRHELEKRLLAPAAPPSQAAPSSDVPEEARPLGSCYRHEDEHS